MTESKLIYAHNRTKKMNHSNIETPITDALYLLMMLRANVCAARNEVASRNSDLPAHKCEELIGRIETPLGMLCRRNGNAYDDLQKYFHQILRKTQEWAAWAVESEERLLLSNRGILTKNLPGGARRRAALVEDPSCEGLKRSIIEQLQVTRSLCAARHRAGGSCPTAHRHALVSIERDFSALVDSGSFGSFGHLTNRLEMLIEQLRGWMDYVNSSGNREPFASSKLDIKPVDIVPAPPPTCPEITYLIQSVAGVHTRLKNAGWFLPRGSKFPVPQVGMGEDVLLNSDRRVAGIVGNVQNILAWGESWKRQACELEPGSWRKKGRIALNFPIRHLSSEELRGICPRPTGIDHLALALALQIERVKQIAKEGPDFGQSGRDVEMRNASKECVILLEEIRDSARSIREWGQEWKVYACLINRAKATDRDMHCLPVAR